MVKVLSLIPVPTPVPTPTPTPTPIPVPQTQTVTLSPAGDTFLYPDYGNVGKMQNLRLYRGSSDDYSSKILLNFDTSAIPANATILSASLELYHVGSDYSTDARTISLCLPTQSWLEGTGEWEYQGASGADWQSTGSALWSTIGGSCGSVLKTSALPFRVTRAFDETRFVKFDVKDVVRSQNGFMLKANVDYRQDEFASRENPDARMRPRLVIQYQTP